MAETTARVGAGGSDGSDRDAEDAGFYHEARLNAAWTGSRLAMGGLSFLFGTFVFAYFYLRALNSHGMWLPSGSIRPHLWSGTLITGLVVLSAATQTAVLQRIKAGGKSTWQRGAAAALLLGLAAVALQIWDLLVLPFSPGASGFASVFTGYSPVYLVIALAAMVWLEILIARSARIPDIHFVEQPPTYQETFALQRFQAALSAFTAVWNYLAAVAVLFWVLFYLL